MIWNNNDSEPFRQPVDYVDHPGKNFKHAFKPFMSLRSSDYLQVIDSPMDLQTVREELLSGNYETPMDFAKDMRRIFQNSRSYNTNKQSRVSSSRKSRLRFHVRRIIRDSLLHEYKL